MMLNQKFYIKVYMYLITKYFYHFILNICIIMVNLFILLILFIIKQHHVLTYNYKIFYIFYQYLYIYYVFQILIIIKNIFQLN